MSLKKYLPVEKYTLVTHLAIDDVKKRIEESVNTEKQKFFTTYRKTSSKPYSGSIQFDRFTITRIIDYRNSFLPVIKGHIYSDKEKTKVDVRMRLPTFILIFLFFWLGIIGVVCLCILIVAIVQFQKILEGGISLPIFIPFVMFIFGCGLTIFGFKSESRKAREFLADLLDAQEIKI